MTDRVGRKPAFGTSQLHWVPAPYKSQLEANRLVVMQDSRSSRTIPVVLILLGGILFFEATPAYACSCGGQSPADAVAGGDAAFVGTYLGRTEPPPAPMVKSSDLVVNHFSVERAIKGDVAGSVDVNAAFSGASCGLELAVGQRTGLVMRHAGDDWESNLCLQIDPEALLALAEPPPPAPQPPSRPRPGPTVVAIPSASPLPTASAGPSPQPSVSATAPEAVDLAAGEGSGPPLLPILLIAGMLAAGLAIALRLRGRFRAQG